MRIYYNFTENKLTQRIKKNNMCSMSCTVVSSPVCGHMEGPEPGQYITYSPQHTRINIVTSLQI